MKYFGGKPRGTRPLQPVEYTVIRGVADKQPKELNEILSGKLEDDSVFVLATEGRQDLDKALQSLFLYMDRERQLISQLTRYQEDFVED